MKGTVCFRLDGDQRIGWGHFFRCFSLANFFTEYEIVFAYKSLDNELIQKIKENEWDFVKIDSDSDVLNWERSLDVFVVDCYEFDPQFLQNLSSTGVFTVYIDDYYDGYIPADVIINHTPNTQEKSYHTKNETKFFFGLEYSMLRKEFIGINETRRIPKIKSAFVSIGGSTRHDLLDHITNEVILSDQFEKITVLSSSEPNNKYKSVEYLNNISADQVKSTIYSSDVCIVPVSTLYMEALACNSIVLGGFFAENHVTVYEKIKNLGLIFPVGDMNRITGNTIKQTISIARKMLPIEYNRKLGSSLPDIVNHIDSMLRK